jgi:hypothetical protein
VKLWQPQWGAFSGQVKKWLIASRVALKTVVLNPNRSSHASGHYCDLAKIEASFAIPVAIAEASAKVRTGPPIDAPEDYALPVWAGEIPLRLTAAAPVADEQGVAQLEVPGYAVDYHRGGSVE